MLRLEEYIGGSAMRLCYRHPHCENKCVKVVSDERNLPELRREIKISKLVAPYLGGCIVDYEDELVETDKGPGMVCGLVRNEDDGSVAPSLYAYQQNFGAAGAEPGLREILRLLIVNDLFFYDFNRSNFAVKRTASCGLKVVFIDLKGFHKNGCMTYLKLERHVAPFARTIMFRRMRTLYKELELDGFPLDGLCREKMFSSLLVGVKL